LSPEAAMQGARATQQGVREKKEDTLNPKPHRPIGVEATTARRSQATSCA